MLIWWEKKTTGYKCYIYHRRNYMPNVIPRLLAELNLPNQAVIMDDVNMYAQNASGAAP